MTVFAVKNDGIFGPGSHSLHRNETGGECGDGGGCLISGGAGGGGGGGGRGGGGSWGYGVGKG